MDPITLPRENGFRLRGARVARRGIVVDTAVAFALTLLAALAIDGDNISRDLWTAFIVYGLGFGGMVVIPLHVARVARAKRRLAAGA
jgi:hypothetical protein